MSTEGRVRRFGETAVWPALRGWGRRSASRGYRPRVEALEDRTLPSFLTAGAYPAGPTPVAVAAGDFNGDGSQDFAVANKGSNTVSVFLGNGDGTFLAGTDSPAGPGPTSVAAGDFNSDGIPDLAVTNAAGVSILLGNGDGSFQARANYGTGSAPVAVAVADLNGDGVLDLAVANEVSGTVSILLGNGDGSFNPPGQDYFVNTFVSTLAVGDFNGDGIPDLAVTSPVAPHQTTGAVTILWGQGDGSFVRGSTLAVGADPTSIAVGDFNGDGITDFAVINSVSAGTLNVFLCHDDGSIQKTTYAAGSMPYAVAAGDFNGDGSIDLAVTSFNLGTVTIWSGQGDGSFQSGDSYTAGPHPAFVAVADINGDGFPDLVVANAVDPGTVAVLVNAADWSPVVPGRYHLPSQGLTAPLTSLDPQGGFQLPPAANGLPPSSMPPVTVEPARGQSDHPDALPGGTSLAPFRQAHDAVFAVWDEPGPDGLGTKLSSLFWTIPAA